MTTMDDLRAHRLWAAAALIALAMILATATFNARRNLVAACEQQATETAPALMSRSQGASDGPAAQDGQPKMTPSSSDVPS